MFTYALAKAVRLGYLDSKYRTSAKRAYKGILDRFVRRDSRGGWTLTDTVYSAGLGGSPYRDGSYEYYVHEKVGSDDPKGIGAFLLASTEMERIKSSK
jgi:unsaturated rhamnogalacturonyl hydrolase